MNSEIGIDIYTQLILSVKYNKDKLMLPKGKEGEEGWLRVSEQVCVHMSVASCVCVCVLKQYCAYICC